MKPLVDGAQSGIRSVIKKTPERGQRAKCNPIDDAAANKTCQSESDHEWECIGMSTGGTDYMCGKCYARKTVPYADQQYLSITAQN